MDSEQAYQIKTRDPDIVHVATRPESTYLIKRLEAWAVEQMLEELNSIDYCISSSTDNHEQRKHSVSWVCCNLIVPISRCLDYIQSRLMAWDVGILFSRYALKFRPRMDGNHVFGWKKIGARKSLQTNEIKFDYSTHCYTVIVPIAIAIVK